MKEIEEMMSMGADVNFVQNVGYSRTALYEAVTSDNYGDDESQQVDVVELLLKNGADANFVSESGDGKRYAIV